MTRAVFVFIVGLLASSFANADFAPYTKESFAAAQKNSEKILLHFSADWCPTCKAQQKTFAELEKTGQLKGLVLMTADYDKETELKKQMHVTHQSTLIAFYSSVETDRSTGQTSKEDLAQFINEKLVKLTLQDQLAMMRQASAAMIPAEKQKIMEQALSDLKAKHLSEKALKVGQTFPDFKLPDANGQPVALAKLLKSGPVVVSFYRGSWCPYCNAQLADFQKNYGEFKARGATLVAITPEKPELEQSMKQSKKIEFDILNDANNKVATRIGLVFGVTPELKSVYQQFGVDLEKSQGNSEWKLPIPATYVIAKNHQVAYAFVDPDYRNRANTAEVLKALDGLKK